MKEFITKEFHGDEKRELNNLVERFVKVGAFCSYEHFIRLSSSIESYIDMARNNAWLTVDQYKQLCNKWALLYTDMQLKRVQYWSRF